MSESVEPTSPPASLGERGAAFWTLLTGIFEFDAAEAELLTQAAGTVDLIADLEQTLSDDGATVDGSKGQVRLHPAVSELRQQRLALARLVGQLDLPDDVGGQVVPSAASLRGRKAAAARWGVHNYGA